MAGLTREDAIQTALARTAAWKPDGFVAIAIGCAQGELTGLFPSDGFVGIDDDPVAITAAAERFPAHHFAPPQTSLASCAEPGSVDLIVAARVLRSRTRAARVDLVATAWKTLAVGGRLVLSDDFVSASKPQSVEPPHVVSIRMLTDEILEATGRAVAIEDVLVLQPDDATLPHEAVLTLLRLGPR